MRLITESQFANVVLLASFRYPVVVVFATELSNAQEALMPVLDGMGSLDGFDAVRVDSGKESALAQFYGVSGSFALVVFRSGKLTDTFKGGRRVTDLRQFLTKNDVSLDYQHYGELL